MCLFLRYGDKVPVGVCSRLFAVAWTITGLVMASILIGVIATSLTFRTLDHDIILYGTKVHMKLLGNQIIYFKLFLGSPASSEFGRQCCTRAQVAYILSALICSLCSTKQFSLALLEKMLG